jgi:hypothetical protein
MSNPPFLPVPLTDAEWLDLIKRETSLYPQIFQHNIENKQWDLMDKNLADLSESIQRVRRYLGVRLQPKSPPPQEPSSQESLAFFFMKNRERMLAFADKLKEHPSAKGLSIILNHDNSLRVNDSVLTSFTLSKLASYMDIDELVELVLRRSIDPELRVIREENEAFAAAREKVLKAPKKKGRKIERENEN